jgi:hypothetical protein
MGQIDFACHCEKRSGEGNPAGLRARSRRTHHDKKTKRTRCRDLRFGVFGMFFPARPTPPRILAGVRIGRVTLPY